LKKRASTGVSNGKFQRREADALERVLQRFLEISGAKRRKLSEFEKEKPGGEFVFSAKNFAVQLEVN